MSKVIAATGAREHAPTSNIDPFSLEFFADLSRLIRSCARPAGRLAVPLRRLAVARYEDVHRVLTDWRTFCSSRGIGMSDFSKEKPWRHRVSSWRRTHPSIPRPRRAQSCAVASVMKQLRDSLRPLPRR